MNVRITPRILSGRTEAISSKSDAHRILICSALADKPVNVELNAFSEDILATANCLASMGAETEKTDFGFAVRPFKKKPGAVELNCRESGSTLRFMLPVAAALGANARFLGAGRLPERPLGHLIEVMENHGVRFSAPKLPFEIDGTLESGCYTLPGNISSQYITGLMLALPLAGDSRIELTTALESAGYVDITISALKKFGVCVNRLENGFEIRRQNYISPGSVKADGDWSNAAFFLAAGAMFGDIAVYGLNAESVQGDRAVADILGRFGAEMAWTDGGLSARRGKLSGCEIDVSGIPDLLPILAVTAAYAEGETRFVNAARLRIKESDRLISTAKLINGLGGSAAELPDGLVVKGGGMRGGTVDGFNDHRIVMAAAIAAAGCESDVVITGAEAVNKSFPTFFEVYNSLGGRADVV